MRNRSSPRRNNLLLIAFCGVAILGMIGFLIWVNHINDRIYASQSWPSTTGVITSTWIKTGEETVGSGPNEYTRTVYVPALAYRYSVNTQTFTSENINVDSSWGLESYESEKQADGYLRRNYPIGREVTVFYNPDDPQDAFLFQREPMSTVEISAIMYALMAFLFGIMLYVLFNLNKTLR